MLPFLKPKKMGSVVGVVTKADGEVKSTGEEGEDVGMVAAAEDILSAIALKDAPALALALRSAYELCESNYDEGSLDVDQA